MEKHGDGRAYWLSLCVICAFVLWPRPVLSAAAVLVAVAIVWSGVRTSWSERSPLRALRDTAFMIALFGSLNLVILYFLWS